MNNLSLSILTPLYNEEEFIASLLDRVPAARVPGGMERELIVVDDGSNDGSAEAVQAFMAARPDCGIRLIRHEKNRGKGAAIRTAIASATGTDSIIQDADLEYDPREYPKLLGPLLSGEADVVYGSRFMAAGERRVMYYWHSLANHLLTTLCNVVADLNLTDMETSRLLAERERFNQAYKAAFDKMLNAGHVSSAEFILAGVTTDEARLDAEVDRVELERHKRIQAKAN